MFGFNRKKPFVRGVDLKGLILEDIDIDTWRQLIWGVLRDESRWILGKAIETDPDTRLNAAEMAARITFEGLPEWQKNNGEKNAQAAVDFNSLSDDAIRKARLAWDLGPLDNSRKRRI